MKYKIGYIDEDSAAVIKYERKLRDNFDIIGYDIEKGLLLDDLLKRVYDSDIDLLMVDYLMVDKGILTYNGDEVVRAYEEIKPKFPMIIFTNEESQAFPQVDNPNIIYDKKLVNDDLAKFCEILTKNIKVYLDYVKKRKDIINSLIEKSTKASLSSKEKSTLFESQAELKNLDKWSNEIPYQLFDLTTTDDIEKTRKEAEAYLESLIKKASNDSI